MNEIIAAVIGSAVGTAGACTYVHFAWIKPEDKRISANEAFWKNVQDEAEARSAAIQDELDSRK
jgi:hypothetical protein